MGDSEHAYRTTISQKPIALLPFYCKVSIGDHASAFFDIPRHVKAASPVSVGEEIIQGRRTP